MAFTKPIGAKGVGAQNPSGAGVGEVEDPKGTLPPDVDPPKKKSWATASGEGAVWNTTGAPRSSTGAVTAPPPQPVVLRPPDPLAANPTRKDPPPPYDVAFEKSVVGGKNKSGKIVEISPGTGNGHASLTIHGINGPPDDLKSFDDLAIKNGDQTLIFAYDSHFRRLGPDSEDLHHQIREWLRANPKGVLDIDAHSLGGRILVRTLALLANDDELKDREVNVNLVAPYVNGDKAANSARSAPKFLQSMIRNLTPSQDIGTTSDFQKDLEKVTRGQFPKGVTITLFTGGKDIRVPANDPRLLKVIDNLKARVVFLPDADHDTIVDLAAAYTAAHANDPK